MAIRDLLPGYMQQPIWQDLCDAIDYVYGESDINSGMKALQHLRYMFVLNDEVREKIANRQMLMSSDLDMMERTLAIRQTNLLGWRVQGAKGLSGTDFTNINRNLGQFWYSKGTEDFIDFIGYCLNADIRMQAMWTENYVTFSETPGGSPVWEGGTWYPTTHVNLQFDGGLTTVISVKELIEIFYDLANYNLVVNAVLIENTSWIVPQEKYGAAAPVSSDILRVGVYPIVETELKNF